MTTYSTRHSRAFSPPLSTHGASTIGPQLQLQRLHIVTRLVIEGRARRDESNVSIKMYLRVRLTVYGYLDSTNLQRDVLVDSTSGQCHPRKHCPLIQRSVFYSMNLLPGLRRLEL